MSMAKTIQTTHEIVEQAFIKDRIHFYEHDNKRKKRWVSIYSLKKEAREMAQRFPEEAQTISEFIKNLK